MIIWARVCTFHSFGHHCRTLCCEGCGHDELARLWMAGAIIVLTLLTLEWCCFCVAGLCKVVWLWSSLFQDFAQSCGGHNFKVFVAHLRAEFRVISRLSTMQWCVHSCRILCSEGCGHYVNLCHYFKGSVKSRGHDDRMYHFWGWWHLWCGETLRVVPAVTILKYFCSTVILW